MKLTTIVSLTAASLTALALHSSLSATPIFNEGFESPTTDNSTPLLTPTGWTFTERDSTSSIGLLSVGSVTPYGDQVYYFFDGSQNNALQTTSSILNTNIAADTTYTLSFNFSSYRNDRPTSFGAKILADDGLGGQTVLAESDFYDPNNGTYFSGGVGLQGDQLDFALSVTPTTNIGQRLVIQLNSNNSNTNTSGAYIDNLSVTAVAVPEPNALLLLGLSGMALILRRRR
jgi:hypothetical protein